MAGMFGRTIPTILNPPTSFGLLKSLFTRNLLPQNVLQNGTTAWGSSTNLLLATCRCKSGGSTLGLGNSTTRGAKNNGHLYAPLQIGKQSKKMKSKRKCPNLTPTPIRFQPKTQNSTFEIPSTLTNTKRVAASFLPSLNANPGKLKGKPCFQTQTECSQSCANLPKPPVLSGNKSFFNNEVVVYTPKNYRKIERKEEDLYNAFERRLIEKQATKNMPVSRSVALTNLRHKETQSEVAANKSSKSPTGFILVEDRYGRSVKSNKPVVENKREFPKNLDTAINDLHINRWENRVQKSLREVSKNCAPTSFIMIDDNVGSVDSNECIANDRRTFVDPRDQMENDVFEQSSKTYQGRDNSNNVSWVPNNTAKLDNKAIVPFNRTNATERSQREKNDGKSEHVLTMQPYGNKGKKETENRQEIMALNQMTSTKKEDNSGSSLDFLNKSIWSKELLNAVERSQKSARTVTLDTNNTKISSDDRIKEGNSSSNKDKKKNGKDMKSKSKMLFGNATENGSKDKLRANSVPSSVKNATGDGPQQKQDLLQDLHAQWKADFRQNYLNMQKESLVKKTVNLPPKTSSLVYTPNSFAKWDDDMQDTNVVSNRWKEKKSSKKSKNKAKSKTSLKNKETREVVFDRRSGSDSTDNKSRIEKQIREITEKIAKSSNNVLSPTRIKSGLHSPMKEWMDVGSVNRDTYYVLLDERMEAFAREKDMDYYNKSLETQKSEIDGVNFNKVVPLINKLDGFLSMNLIPVQDSTPGQNPRGKSVPSSFKPMKMSHEQQSDLLKKNHDLLEKNRLLRNMLAIRRYQDQAQKEKEEKKKKKKNVKRKKGSADIEGKPKRSSIRSQKSNKL